MELSNEVIIAIIGGAAAIITGWIGNQKGKKANNTQAEDIKILSNSYIELIEALKKDNVDLRRERDDFKRQLDAHDANQNQTNTHSMEEQADGSGD